jgi:phage baseplate assembly protein V
MPSPETLPADINRRIESLLRVGKVSDVDHAAGKCRVRTGGIETQHLPWMERREGTTNDWDPPTIGEQCLVLSPSGETAGGIVLLGVPSTAHPQPAHDENLCQRVFPDGATLRYDHAGHHYALTVPDGGSITLAIGATTLTLTGAGVTLATPKFEGVQT